MPELVSEAAATALVQFYLCVLLLLVLPLLVLVFFVHLVFQFLVVVVVFGRPPLIVLVDESR